MPVLSGRDLAFGAINGSIFGLMFSFVLRNFEVALNPLLSIIVFSLLAVFGIYIGYLLSKWKTFFFQLAKFSAVGATNFSIDTGIFNLLMYVTQISVGNNIDFFKGIAFLVATINSYFWNKHWSFTKKDSTSSKKEFLLFLSISIIGAVINIGIVHTFVNIIGTPSTGISSKLWANIASVVATFIVLIWNFLGYKFLVFKK